MATLACVLGKMRQALGKRMSLNMQQRNDPRVKTPIAVAKTQPIPNRSATADRNENQRTQCATCQHQLDTERRKWRVAEPV